MKRYVCSDLHLGHTGVTRFRPFKKDEEHHNFMYDRLLEVDGKKVMIFFLGDIALTPYWLQKIKELKCRKILILGNHDLDRDVKHITELVDVYDEVYSLKKYKGYWLSHAPIHPDELRGKKNIHGHTHYHYIKDSDGELDSRYINVCPEYSRYIQSWEHLISEDYLKDAKVYNSEYEYQGLC